MCDGIGKVVLAMILSTTTVYAETPTAAGYLAKEHYTEGQKRYNLGEYQVALEEFKAAYLIKTDPAFLFNVAQCQRQLRDYAGAEKSYRAFLREASVDSEQRESVKKLVTDMTTAQADERARRPPTGTKPPAEDGMQRVFAIVPPTAPKPWHTRPLAIAGFVLMPLGLVLAGGGGSLLGKSSSLSSDAMTAMFLGDRQRLQADADSYRAGGYTMVGIGVAVALTGVVLTAVGSKR